MAVQHVLPVVKRGIIADMIQAFAKPARSGTPLEVDLQSGTANQQIRIAICSSYTVIIGPLPGVIQPSGISRHAWIEYTRIIEDDSTCGKNNRDKEPHRKSHSIPSIIDIALDEPIFVF